MAALTVRFKDRAPGLSGGPSIGRPGRPHDPQAWFRLTQERSQRNPLLQVRSRFPSDRFEARAGDVEALPLGTNHVHAVLANMVLHHAENLHQARYLARMNDPDKANQFILEVGAEESISSRVS